MLVKGHGDRGGAKPVGLPQFGCTLLHQLHAWAALLCRNLLQVENIPDGGVVRLHLVVGNFGWPACLKNGFGWNGGYIRVNQRTAANTSAGDDSLCLAKTRSTFEINKMQRRLCNMLHGPAGAITGQTRFSVGTVTPSAATEGFDLVGSDLFFPLPISIF